MTISLTRSIDFGSIDSSSTLTLHALVKMFQDASILHSKQANLESKKLFNKETGWVLYQYCIIVNKWPEYEDEIEITTWHNGIKEYKAYREFEVHSNRKKIASATAIYLLYNSILNRIERIPDRINSIYFTGNKLGSHKELDQWVPVSKFNSEFEMDMNTRYSDFDPNGHVNHSSYFDFVETLLFTYRKRETKIKKIKITYTKEMNKAMVRFKSALSENEGYWKFKIWNENLLFAHGEVEIV